MLPSRWVLLALAVITAWAFASRSGLAQGTAFTTQARQAILIDADTSAVLLQHNADELMHPASMSKLMTLVMMFRAIKAGQLKMEDEFLMSVNAWRRGGAPSGTSAMMVPVGSKATISDLLQGIIVQSGNDAAIAVAENMAGSEDAFAQLMTAYGRELGLKSTTFKNATGLHHAEHLTTARDLALLAQHIIREYPDFYRMFAQPDFRYRKHRFVNRNPLLSADLGVDGLKTGYIKEGGYGMVASAKQGERRLIVVVNGLPTAARRREEAARVLEWGFRSFTEFRIFDEGEVVGRARVWGGSQFYLPLTGDGDVSVLLPRAAAGQRLRAEIIYNSPLKPPIRKGDAVARLRVTSAMNTTNEVPLYAAQDIAAAGTMRRGLDSLAYMAFRWIP
ncbi:MAG: D-alanyl-D-alanine carboxypeptidase [Hyphomicrobiaceae bacterium]|nr:D-alanyl-D-alanine carboxypeptidase [Hyphomicrobiaceae bacterium]